MSNFRYDLGRTQLGTGQIDWLADDIRTLLVTDVYVAEIGDQYVSDIPADGVAIRGPLLTAKSVEAGYYRSLTTRYADLLLPNQIKGIVFYKDTGDDATSVLLAYADEAPAFPFTPVGFHYDFSYDASKGGYWRS